MRSICGYREEVEPLVKIIEILLRRNRGKTDGQVEGRYETRHESPAAIRR